MDKSVGVQIIIGQAAVGVHNLRVVPAQAPAAMVQAATVEMVYMYLLLVDI
jgi:hypothetical protein